MGGVDTTGGCGRNLGMMDAASTQTGKLEHVSVGFVCVCGGI